MALADVQFSRQGQAVIARMTGEIDLSNAGNIAGAIIDAMPNASLTLVLDLSAVDYLDSAGISLIYQLRESLRTRSQTLRLVVPSNSPASDALRLAGVLRHIETIETVAAALHNIG
ncbi:MAG TPA: STAS domain-containing protein [Solirubrobacteraceae bacterium]